MNPIIVAAIIGAAGTIIVSVINVWGGKSRQLSEGTRPEGPSGVGEGSQGAPTGSESKREARSNSSRNGYVIWTGHLRTLFLLILIGSGMFWVYQRFWTDGRAARISITMVPLASDWRGQSIRSIEGTVSGTVPVGVHVVVYTYAGQQWFVQPDTQYPITSISADHAWKTATRHGEQYAALLVTDGFVPPPYASALPVGAQVLAFDQVEGR